MSDDPRRVDVAEEALLRSAVGPWLTLPGRVFLHRQAAATIVAALDAHDREHLRHVAFDSADNVAARERERIARAIEADLNRWLSLGSPGAADSSVEGSVAWFVQRAYESCARIARGRA